MVMGGGGDGLMIGNYGPMGMGHGFDGSMIVVLVPVGHGSWVRQSDDHGFGSCGS